MSKHPRFVKDGGMHLDPDASPFVPSSSNFTSTHENKKYSSSEHKNKSSSSKHRPAQSRSNNSQRMHTQTRRSSSRFFP